MTDENNGYDDLFDDRFFRATLSSTARDAPGAAAPRSTSEMRAHTHYEALGMTADSMNAGLGSFAARRPYDAMQALHAPPNGPHIYRAGTGAWKWTDTSAN